MAAGRGLWPTSGSNRSSKDDGACNLKSLAIFLSTERFTMNIYLCLLLENKLGKHRIMLTSEQETLVYTYLPSQFRLSYSVPKRRKSYQSLSFILLIWPRYSNILLTPKWRCVILLVKCSFVKTSYIKFSFPYSRWCLLPTIILQHNNKY